MRWGYVVVIITFNGVRVGRKDVCPVTSCLCIYMSEGENLHGFAVNFTDYSEHAHDLFLLFFFCEDGSKKTNSQKFAANIKFHN